MRTGIGGDYEAIHTEIPAGARIIVGGIDSTKPTANLDAMLTNGDIYPYWSKGKDLEERNADFAKKTVKDDPQPAAAASLKEQALEAGDDKARALSMKMFTVPLGNGNDISVYDPKIKESPNYDMAKETLATKFKIDIDSIKGLGDPEAGTQAVKTMRADVGKSLEIGTRTDKPVKAFIPDAPLVIEANGTQWHAGPETAIVIRGNNDISTLATSKIIDTQGGEKLKASDDYIVSGNRGGGKLAVNEIVPETRGMSESLAVGSPEAKQQQLGG